MSTQNDTVVSDESQASQLLREVLGARSPPQVHVLRPSDKGKVSHAMELSPQSSPRDLPPRYRFHSLGHTQSRNADDFTNILHGEPTGAIEESTFPDSSPFSHIDLARYSTQGAGTQDHPIHEARYYSKNKRCNDNSPAMGDTPKFSTSSAAGKSPTSRAHAYNLMINSSSPDAPRSSPAGQGASLVKLRSTVKPSTDPHEGDASPATPSPPLAQGGVCNSTEDVGVDALFVSESGISQEARRLLMQPDSLSWSQNSDLLHGQGHLSDSGSEGFRTAAFGTQPAEEEDYQPTEPANSFRYEPTQLANEPTQPAFGHPSISLILDSDQPRLPHPDSPSKVIPGISSMVNPAKRWRIRGALPLRTSPPPQSGADAPSSIALNYTLGDSPERQDSGGLDLREETQVCAQVSQSRRQRWEQSRTFSNSEARNPELSFDSAASSLHHPLPGPSRDWRDSVPCDMDGPSLSTTRRFSGQSGTSGQDQHPDQAFPQPESSDEEVPLAFLRPARQLLAREESAARMPPPTTRVRRFNQGNSKPIADYRHTSTSRLEPQAFPEHTNTSRPKKSNSPTILNSRLTSPITSENDTACGEELPTVPNKADGETALLNGEYVAATHKGAATVQSRKRKRVASTTAGKLKAVSKPVLRSTTTPLGHPPKRLKASSSTRSSLYMPTRVFALWRNDAYYYPGVVHSQPDPPNAGYIIQFDDETEDTVELVNLRQCKLVEGDSVSVAGKSRKGRVVQVHGDLLVVRFAEGAHQVDYEIHIRDVKVAAGTVKNDWNDRRIAKDQIVTSVRPKPTSETPSKGLATSLGTSKGSRNPKQLSGIGLVVTLSPNNGIWETEKGRVIDAIKRNGGIVLDDWGQVFKLDGNVEKSGKRWVAYKADVTLLRPDLENVFLVSDAHHQKPRYLIALALGIPCVSSDWLLADGELQAWPSRLLPAGFSVQLHYRMSQLINLDWGDEDRHLESIVHNLAPSKVFSGKSLLYLSPDFTPAMKNARRTKTNTEQAMEANRTIPKILLCMGATRVEAVANAKDTSQDLEEFDYIVVKEPHEVDLYTSPGAHCVHFKWVKDCLVAGRLLPRDFDYST